MQTAQDILGRPKYNNVRENGNEISSSFLDNPPYCYDVSDMI